MTDPIVVAELKAIAEHHGGVLRAADVVNAARDPESVLHDKFDWSDAEAAEKWRLQQARSLIRVVVEPCGSPENKVVTRVFVSLTPDRKEGGGAYRTTAAVMSNAAYRAQLLADALSEMQAFEKKYHELSELADVFAAMRKAKPVAA